MIAYNLLDHKILNTKYLFLFVNIKMKKIFEFINFINEISLINLRKYLKIFTF